MDELYAIALFLFVLFLLLGSGVWVGLALMGVAWVGMELFTSRPVGDTMITTPSDRRGNWQRSLHKSRAGQGWPGPR